MKDWFYGQAGKPSGPFSEEEMLEMFRQNKINRTTLVWKDGTADWQPLEKSELAQKLPGVPPPLSPHIRLASPLRRLAAVVLDMVILICFPLILVIFVVIIFASGLAMANNEDPIAAGLFVFSLGAFIVSAVNIFLLWRSGQTIGKRALGVMIAGMDGNKAPLWRILILRIGVFYYVPWMVSDMSGNNSLVELLVGILLLADLLMILRNGHRTLHDFLAGTIVVRRETGASPDQP